MDFKNAFSLIELLISLIIISLILSALVPILTKKTKNQFLLNNSYLTINCETKHFKGCKNCTNNTCIECEKGILTPDKKSCLLERKPNSKEDCEKYNAIYINDNDKTSDGFCVTKYNANDALGPVVPKEYVTLVTINSTCSNSVCCWYGKSSDGCTNNLSSIPIGTNTPYFNYNACNRTVCTYQAAQNICAQHSISDSQKGDWRLMNQNEAKRITELISKETKSNPIILNYKGADGLQFCDKYDSNISIPTCENGVSYSSCYGSNENTCRPAHIWMLHTGANLNNYACAHKSCGMNYFNYSASNSRYAFSVRCILDKIRL